MPQTHMEIICSNSVCIFTDSMFAVGVKGNIKANLHIDNVKNLINYLSISEDNNAMFREMSAELKQVQMFQCSYKEMFEFNDELVDYKKIIYPFSVDLKS